MDLGGLVLGLLWIGSLFALGFAHTIVYYLPLVIAVFAFFGVMLFLMFYCIIKIVVKKIFCANSERDIRIIGFSNAVLNVIKAFVSAGSYLLLFGVIVWLGIQFEPSALILPIVVILLIQLIAAVVLKRMGKLNAVCFTLFLLIEPYLLLYILIGDYYSRGLLLW
jgi:hypothetical protein